MTLAVVLCCAMTTVFISCDKDEELVKPTSGSTVITIDNISLYQDLDMLDYIQEYISEGKMVVTDTLLIYDAAGKLVNKLGVEANNLQPQIFEAKDLPNGTYTVVAWQAVRGGRSENRAWVLSDDEQLSTVNLNTKYGCISWVWATGIASATVAIDGNNVQTTITPKSIGSIVTMQVDGYTEESEYSELRLYQPYRKVYGIDLDPTRSSEEERWMVKEDEKTRLMGVISILERGKSTTNKFFTLNHGDDMTLTIWGKKGDMFHSIATSNHVKIHTDDHVTCYCHIDRLNWQPPFFGTDEAFATWKADRDNGILVFDPYLNWGCNVDAVLQHTHNIQWWHDGNETLEYDESWNLWKRWGWVANYLRDYYYFETEDGKNLKWVECRCPDSAGLPVEAGAEMLLKQGYVYSGKIKFPYYTKPEDLYFSADGNIEVFLQTYTGGWRILYQPTDPDDFQYIINE